MIRTKKFENLPQITTISPSGKIVITENGVDKVISFEDFSNLPPAPEVWNNPSTTFTASEINVTDIQSAADSKLLDLKINTVSKFVVRKDGNLGIGVANPAARLDISDTVLAGSGSLAGSILNLAQTWNTTGAPTAIKLNVTNTASGAASNLLDLQVGGISKFNVKKITTPVSIGDTAQFSRVMVGNFGFGMDNGYNYDGYLFSGTEAVLGWRATFGVTSLSFTACDGYLGIGSDSRVLYAAGSADVRLYRDSANTFAQRNGVNPQAFRLYNTYTSSTNFERLNLRWDANVLKIGTEKGNAGGTARNLGFETDGTTRMTITSTGLVGIGTTNPAASLDIQGASSGIFLGRSDSEKYIYIQTSASTGYTANSFAIWNGITAAWAGLIMQFTENAALIFNRDIQNAYTNIRGANVSEPALNITQTSTGDFLSAGTFRVAKSGNLGIGNTVPAARLDIVDTWNSNISVTGATGTGSVATITFATQAAVIPVGATVVVSSVNPSGYNGTFVVTASTVTSISYTNSTTATYVSGGTVQQQYSSVKVVATDTSSAATSNLLELWSGSTPTLNFNVEKGGKVILKSGAGNTTGLQIGNANIDNNGASVLTVRMNGGRQLQVSSVATFVNALSLGTDNLDTLLYRDAAATLALRNGVNPQAFRLYGTYTDVNNYARLAISCDTSGNAILATEGLGTGAAGTLSINGVPVGLGKGNISSNIAIGTGALSFTATGGGNIAIGRSSGVGITTGINNIAIGYQTLGSHYSGSNVVAIGGAACGFNTGCSASVFIGTSSGPGSDNQTNQIAIGYQVAGLGSNSVVLGNSSITKTALRGNVGIGTTAPTANLEVFQPTTGIGTISIAAGGTTVTGVGTQFTNTFKVGDTITSAAQTLTISAIASDTSMTTSAAEALISGQAYTLVGGSRFRVSGNGNIGIGTTTPVARLDILDTTLAGSGSLAGSILNLAQTWNTTGAPTAIKLNVTNTASGAASYLLDLQVDTVNKFAVTKTGKVFFSGHTGYTTFIEGFTNTRIDLGNTAGSMLTLNYITGMSVPSEYYIGWSSTGLSSGTVDTRLFRDGAANILGLRNGVNPQVFRLYNTYTDVSNYERGFIGWSSSVLSIGTEQAGSGLARNMTIISSGRLLLRGGVSQSLRLGAGGVDRWDISSDGHLIAITDNAYDIGASGATRPRTGYFGTSIVTPTIVMGGSNQTIGLSLYGIDLAGNGLSRANSILLTSSTASATAVNTARIDSPSAGLIEFRSADDSAYAQINASGLGLVSTGASALITTSNGGVADTLLGKIAYMSTSGLLVKSDGVIGFGAGQVNASSIADTAIYRDASGIIAQRDGFNAQTYRIYGKYTDINNYSRLSITCDTNGNGILVTEGVGTGAAGSISINGLLLGLGAGNVSSNVAVGPLALPVNTTGSYNTAVGRATLNKNTTGYYNTAVGNGASFSNTTGYQNTAVGESALDLNTTGALNVAIGYLAGSTTLTGQNTITNSSIFIGNNTRANASGQTNQIVIGSSATGIGSNSVVLGNDSILTTALKGRVGIGTTNPQSNLEIYGATSTLTINTGDGSTTAGLRFAHRDSVYADSQIKVGIFAPAAGSYGLSTGLFFALNNATDNTNVSVSDSKLAILANGNVGIGTSSPTTPLSIVSSSNGSAFNILGIAGNFIFQVGGVNGVGLISQSNSSTAGFVIGTDGASTTAGSMLRLQTQGSTRLVIDNTGNVGIGTTTPSTKLEIVTTGASVDGLKLNRAADDRTAWLVDEGTGAGALYLFNGSNSNSVFITGNGNSHISSGTLGLGVSNSSAAKLDILDTTLAGSGSLAGSILNLAQTWNTTGAPTAIKLNVTNTASGAASNLLDLQVDTTSKFKINKNGVVSISDSLTGGGGGGQGGIFNEGGLYVLWSAGATGVSAGGFLGFNNGNNYSTSAGWDLRIYRDASNTLALRNGVNPQTFRLYNTYTDATTFERLNIKWESNILVIGTEKGSVGGSARALVFQTDGVTRMAIAADNSFASITTNILTIGSQLRLGSTNSRISCNIDGIIRITSSSESDFNRLQFGGTTSSFPSIKRNGAAIQIRLADDSANAALETADLTVVGNASVSGHFSAATKSFLIDHPTKEGKKLQYGVVESNQHSVLVRGKTAENIIELPEEWAGLVHEDSVTVQLTPIGSYQQLFVISQDNQRVVVGGSTGQYNYTIYGERKDVDKLITEI